MALIKIDPDTLFNLLDYVPTKEIANICEQDPSLGETICQDDEFWHQRAKKDFGAFAEEWESTSGTGSERYVQLKRIVDDFDNDDDYWKKKAKHDFGDFAFNWVKWDDMKGTAYERYQKVKNTPRPPTQRTVTQEMKKLVQDRAILMGSSPSYYSHPSDSWLV